MSELRDVIAGILIDNPRKPPRVVANLIVDAIGSSPRRAKPRPVVADGCHCAEYAAAIADRSILAQAIDAAESQGRLRQFAWQIAEYGRVGRRTG